MKIRHKLTLGYALIVFFVGLVGYISLNSVNTFNTLFLRLAHDRVPTIEALGELKFAGLRIVSSTIEFGFIKAELPGGQDRRSSHQIRYRPPR